MKSLAKLYVRREWGIQKVELPGGSINIQLDGRWTVRHTDGEFINAYNSLGFIRGFFLNHDVVVFGAEND